MGGMLMDGAGDLGLTQTATEELSTMAATRVKGDTNAWKLYPGICANLDSYIGSPVGINQDTELAIQRSTSASLTNQFLPAGSFVVATVTLGNEVQVLVYLGQTLVATTSVVI
jgi:hypothetical protein